jgi:hypothetical protein
MPLAKRAQRDVQSSTARGLAMLGAFLVSEAHPEVSIHEPIEFGGRLEYKFPKGYEPRR